MGLFVGFFDEQEGLQNSGQPSLALVASFPTLLHLFAGFHATQEQYFTLPFLLIHFQLESFVQSTVGEEVGCEDKKFCQ